MNKKITEHILLRSKEITALLLWDIGAIKINLDEPYKLVSGNYSPIYINCRQVISSPSFMHLFTAFAHTIIERRRIKADVIAGGETAGIPFGAYVAKSLSLSMVYVRKAKKGHGLTSLVEGVIPQKMRVLLVEDLITDAASKMGFIESIKEVGGEVKDVFVLFDREQGGKEALAAGSIRLHAVTDMTTALIAASGAKLLSANDLESVESYLVNPREWNRDRGLSFT